MQRHVTDSGPSLIESGALNDGLSMAWDPHGDESSMSSLRPTIAANVAAGSTKAEIAFQQVRSWILTGDLAPGEVLDQVALAKAVGVSTTPMREALRRLEAEELMQVRAHRRVVVAPLSRSELVDIYGVRLKLDALASQMAAERMTDEQIRRLETVASPRAEDERVPFNRAFHGTIYRASGNIVLTRILDSLHSRSARYQRILGESNVSLDVQSAHHLNIMNAMLKRDKAEIARLVEEHLSTARDMILERLPN
jgi:DNA-binding GntR family transcriptional regulator